MSSKSILLITVFTLLVINLFIINLFTLHESRIIRVASTLTFFTLFIYYKGYKETWVFIAFICFLISDYLMILYEIPFCNKLTSVLTIFGYFSLIYHVLKRKIKHKTNTKKLYFYAFLILLCFYTLFKIINSIEVKLDDFFQKIILYIYGLTIITVCITAANHKKGITKSMYFIFSVFAFALSDFCAVIAYYLDFYELYYVDRIIYLFALFFMVHYILIPTDNKDYVLN